MGDTAVQDGTGQRRVLSSQPEDANPRNVPEGLVAVPGKPGMEPMSMGGCRWVAAGASHHGRLQGARGRAGWVWAPTWPRLQMPVSMQVAPGITEQRVITEW